MSDVTQILSQIESGDPSVAEKLLPIVYEELRKLAAAKLAQEKPGQTLQATALVHEAYLRLVDVENAQHWDSRGHFFAAAAEAMRPERKRGQVQFVRSTLRAVPANWTCPLFRVQHPRAFEAAGPSLPRRAARASERHHPPRHQAG